MRHLKHPWTHVGLIVAVVVLGVTGVTWVTFGRSAPSSVAVERPPTGETTVTTEAPTTTATTEAPTTVPVTEPPTTVAPIVPDSPFDPADAAHPGRIVDPKVDRPDASIVWDNATGEYWMFTTNQWYAHVPSYHAPAPTGPWTWNGDALPKIPAWAIDDGVHIWSPDVVPFNGVWAMWGAAYEAKTQRMCLYRAVAGTVNGPYVVDPAEPGLCTKSQGGSIDPQQVRDDQGTWWMLFKVDGNEIGSPTSIVTVKLDPAGHPVGDPRTILNASQPWESGLIESPAMFKDTKRNQWWLTFSGGNFSETNTDYQIAATPCDGPAGPCLDAPGPMIQSNEQGQGPGEQGIFLDKKGTIWMAYGPWAPFIRDKPRPLTLVKVGFWSNGLLYVSTP